jgi:hypothetical protein
VARRGPSPVSGARPAAAGSEGVGKQAAEARGRAGEVGGQREASRDGRRRRRRCLRSPRRPTARPGRRDLGNAARDWPLGGRIPSGMPPRADGQVQPRERAVGGSPAPSRPGGPHLARFQNVGRRCCLRSRACGPWTTGPSRLDVSRGEAEELLFSHRGSLCWSPPSRQHLAKQGGRRSP